MQVAIYRFHTSKIFQEILVLFFCISLIARFIMQFEILDYL